MLIVPPTNVFDATPAVILVMVLLDLTVCRALLSCS